MANRTLFLTQYAPPRPAAAARRLGQLIARAVREDEAVFVIRGDRGYGGAEVAGAQVFPLPLSDLRTVVSNRPAGTLRADSRVWSLLEWLRPLRQTFPLVYVADDGGRAYRRRAYALAERLVREEGITHLVSSFRPWADHLVARRLKRRFPHLHWTADFRDLPVDTVREFTLWPALQRRWTRRMLRRADVDRKSVV